MGRLKRAHIHGWAKRGLRLVRAWAIPVIVALLVVFGASRVLASNPPTSAELATYLQSNTLQVGTESIDGKQQVYYVYNGEDFFITTDANNHTDAAASGQYVVWTTTINGQAQIFLYDVLSQSLLQLSSANTNLNPRLDQNKVVWEHWTGSSWQIDYYDGTSVSQVSQGSVDVRPDIHSGLIVYAEQTGPGAWQDIEYDTSSSQYTTVQTGNETIAWPHFLNGTLKFNYSDDTVDYDN